MSGITCSSPKIPSRLAAQEEARDRIQSARRAKKAQRTTPKKAWNPLANAGTKPSDKPERIEPTYHDDPATLHAVFKKGKWAATGIWSDGLTPILRVMRTKEFKRACAVCGHHAAHDKAVEGILAAQGAK